MEQIDTNMIAETEFAALLAQTAPNAAHLCKEMILAKETISIAEQRIETLKPLIEALRVGKETFVDGKFRNKAGKYKINHIATGQTRVSLDSVKEWLAAGIITQEQFEAATKYSDGTHNRVTFKAGTGK